MPHRASRTTKCVRGLLNHIVEPKDSPQSIRAPLLFFPHLALAKLVPPYPKSILCGEAHQLGDERIGILMLVEEPEA